MAKIDYYEKIEKLLQKTPKPIYVAFAISCARDQLHNIKDEAIHKACANALAVTEAYNKGLATQAEVEAAYNAAHSAANAAYSAANAAHSAAYNAAHSAANSAANSAAYSAANSAAYSAAYNAKLKEYYETLVEMLKSLSQLEKIIHNIS